MKNVLGIVALLLLSIGAYAQVPATPVKTDSVKKLRSKLHQRMGLQYEETLTVM
ncbi:hypothetical protein [Pedobacter steynii]